MKRSVTKAEVEAAGKLWAQQRNEKPIPVTYTEPVRYRPALGICPNCHRACADSIAPGRHGVRWLGGRLVNCIDEEVAP